METGEEVGVRRRWKIRGAKGGRGESLARDGGRYEGTAYSTQRSRAEVTREIHHRTRRRYSQILSKVDDILG